MATPWFHNRQSTLLEIKEFHSISNHTIKKTIKTDDTLFIQGLMKRIEKLPVEGGIMKSFSSDTEEIDLLFYAGEQVQTIQIFDKRFKTPSSGFNEKNEMETKLYNEIKSILSNGFRNSR